MNHADEALYVNVKIDPVIKTWNTIQILNMYLHTALYVNSHRNTGHWGIFTTTYQRCHKDIFIL